MEAQVIKRLFVYDDLNGGKPVADPMPGGTPDDVRKLLAVQTPSLTNATIEGPEVSGAVHTYRFRRAVGTKG